MSDFKRLSDRVFASPQITVADVERARALGVDVIVNNRPEGEAEDQTAGSAIEAAAQAAGIDYVAIPITPGQFSQAEVEAMAEALGRSEGKVLAYCRTGTRSTLLWALAQARQGVPLEAIAATASAAGYDVSPVVPAMAQLASHRQA